MKPQLQQQSRGSVSKKEDVEEKKKRVVLDEKHFRRMDKFTGEVSQFRMWMLNLGVVLGQVDGDLAEEVRKIMSREDTRRVPK
eukprot:11456356-Karenia_brevis.AAC.1